MLLLLLAEDLQLEEELLLLQEPSVRGVHGRFAGLVLLVWGNVLVVLELFHPGFGLFALLAAAFLRGGLLLTLLQEKRGGTRVYATGREGQLQLHPEMGSRAPTFTRVGPGFEDAVLIGGTDGWNTEWPLVETTVVACGAGGNT